MMRCLRKNKRTVWYSRYLGKQPVWYEDEEHNIVYTGEEETMYSEPMRIGANISPAKGTAGTEIFGVTEDYDCVLMFAANEKIDINEYSRVWIDADVSDAPDYVVKRVAKGLNVISVGVTKVTVE